MYNTEFDCSVNPKNSTGVCSILGVQYGTVSGISEAQCYGVHTKFSHACQVDLSSK